MNQVIGVDFDHTIWDTPNHKPLPFAWDFLEALHDRGHKVLIHSCNNPKWIRKQCEEFNLHVDYVWGELGIEGGKPVCAAYVDDRAVAFRGDWKQALRDVDDLVAGKSVKDYKGPQYINNPVREAELNNDNEDDGA